MSAIYAPLSSDGEASGTTTIGRGVTFTTTGGSYFMQNAMSTLTSAGNTTFTGDLNYALGNVHVTEGTFVAYNSRTRVIKKDAVLDVPNATDYKIYTGADESSASERTGATSYGGTDKYIKVVGPALTSDDLNNVNIISGGNMTKRYGEESQSISAGEAIINVVYTADDGYYFPESYSVASVNGVTVTRNSDTEITVSGTPTAAASITLPDASLIPPTPYDLYIGGVQVTSANASDVLGNGTVSYDNGTKTLTLNNASITSPYNPKGKQYYGIYAKDIAGLQIVVQGNSVVDIAHQESSNMVRAIWIENSSEDNATITCNGNLTVKAETSGINITKTNLTVNGSGTLSVESQYGIVGNIALNIDGNATVNLTANSGFPAALLGEGGAFAVNVGENATLNATSTYWGTQRVTSITSAGTTSITSTGPYGVYGEGGNTAIQISGGNFSVSGTSWAIRNASIGISSGLAIYAGNDESSASLQSGASYGGDAKYVKVTVPTTYTVNITMDSYTYIGSINGDASQTVNAGDSMTNVVYTANGGCFPESYSVAPVNGITVTRNSATGITVSGTPTADTNITLPGASAHSPAPAVEENVNPATCEDGGSYDEVVYCSVCGEELSREGKTTDPLNHNWGEPVYDWTEYYDEVQATRTCLRDESHREGEGVHTTSEVTKPATTTEKGEHTYTATFTNPAFTTQTKVVADIPMVVSYGVWVGGVQITGDNVADVFGDGTVSYDADTNTLTLDNANISSTTGTSYKEWYGIYAENTLNITVKGTNTVKGQDNVSDSCGIYGEGLVITFVDGATLTAEGGSRPKDGSGNTPDARSYGISAHYADIEIKGSGTLTATGGDIESDYSASSSAGIAHGGKLIINGDIDVTATGGSVEGGWSYGVATKVEINGGKLTATGGQANKGSWGIEGETITINGGTIEAKSVSTVEPALAVSVAPTLGDGVSASASENSTGSGSEEYDQTSNDGYKWFKATDVVTYTINFNANGGSVTTASDTTGTDGKLAGLPTPTRSSYNFNGWYTAASGGTKVTADTVFTADTEIFAQWSKKSGSSLGVSSGAATYAVTPATVENGSVSASPKNASKGSTVTVNVTPNKGYKLDKLTVTDKDGNEIEVTENSGKYTFTMPAASVDITPVFVKESTSDSDKDNNGKDENGKDNSENKDNDGKDTDNNQGSKDISFTDVSSSDYFFDAVVWAAKENITSGTSDTTFGSNESCTRAQTVTFLWRAAGSPEPTISENPFTDVNEGDYFYKAVLWAYENGITLGTDDDKFSPNDTVTRGQTVTFLYRLAGEKTDGENPFADVSEGDYYYDSVLWAYQNEITGGTTGTTFSPDDNCLRAQIVTFLYRCYK